MTEEEVISEFTDLYWNKRAPWTRTKWLGCGIAKCPLDLFVYQEIIVETRPDVIFETGSCVGGSALFFASIFDVLGHGQVVTVDIHRYEQVQHPRITYLHGDSTDREIVSEVQSLVKGRGMVILDSLHTLEQVKAELELYNHLVSPTCYLVVEDTGVDKSWGKPAASAAVQEFLNTHQDFQVDLSREYHLLTFNPSGWLKRS